MSLAIRPLRLES